MTEPDPYKTLQVDPEAEDEVIVAAYRRLAMK
jgi:DnaJ-class molecular chaperone